MAEGQIVVDGPAREVMSDSQVFSSQINKLFRDHLANVYHLLNLAPPDDLSRLTRPSPSWPLHSFPMSGDVAGHTLFEWSGTLRKLLIRTGISFPAE